MHYCVKYGLLRFEDSVVFCNNLSHWNLVLNCISCRLNMVPFLDAHQALHTAICVTFTWWTMRGHSSDKSFCLGSLWQRASTLRSARMHDRVLGLLKGHYPFSEHLTSSSDTLYLLGPMNHIRSPTSSPFICSNVFSAWGKEKISFISMLLSAPLSKVG